MPGFPNDAKQPITSAELREALSEVLARFHCHAGTIHLLDAASGLLRLEAHVNIPPQVVEKIAHVPVGKGMAGLAAQRRKPVQVCNLQTDSSDVARPGARATQMEGSVAVPILAAGELRGVLGIAKTTAHEWSEGECEQLMAVAAQIGTRFA